MSEPFDLKSIKPPHGEMDGRGKFSPNLYRWMSRSPKEVQARTSVWRDKEGILWIGYKAREEWFIGSRLFRVLTAGCRQEIYAVRPKDAKHFREIKTFWARYRKLGRCAIDPQHKTFWAHDDTRWDVTRSGRSCLWCGKFKQRRVVKTIVHRKREETWVTA